MTRRGRLSLSRLELVSGLSRRALVLIAVPAIALIVASFWLAAQFLHPLPPRRIVLATGPEHGMLQAFGQCYREILARNGIAVELRSTTGAKENLELLRSGTGVDVAFLVAGITTPAEAAGLVNVVNIFPGPLWILYRSEKELKEIDELAGRRVAIGAPGSAIGTLVAPLLAANGITAENTLLVPLPFEAALRALRNGEVDVALLSEDPFVPAFLETLASPGIRLMDLARADAYARRYPHLHRMDLPAGTLDLARRLPQQDVRLIGGVAMIAARDSLHATIVDLVVDAAREIHGDQGYFERRGEFPNARQVDAIPVSEESVRYLRGGMPFLRRYLPLWLADFLQRIFTLSLPIIAVVLPLANWIPKGVDAFMRRRIDDVYEELRSIEQQRIEGGPDLDVDALRAEVSRVEADVARLRVPLKFSRELYVLRAHVRMVREGLPDHPRAGA